jgi:hypothetical protein
LSATNTAKLVAVASCGRTACPSKRQVDGGQMDRTFGYGRTVPTAGSLAASVGMRVASAGGQEHHREARKSLEISLTCKHDIVSNQYDKRNFNLEIA